MQRGDGGSGRRCWLDQGQREEKTPLLQESERSERSHRRCDKAPGKDGERVRPGAVVGRLERLRRKLTLSNSHPPPDK